MALKKLIKNIALSRGYLIMNVSRDYDPEKGYTLHSYTTPDGKFDYEKYRAVQTRGNKDKIDRVWVVRENIEFLASYIKKRIPKPEFGLCHGTRRGLEQKWFRELLGCDVLGTEISETATQFENTLQWDFHEVKPEWIEKCDFIYSNSFDHSYDPEKCLNAWMSCVKPGGLCILEHSSLHSYEGASELDPFGADLYQMPYLVTVWGAGRYGIREILKCPSNPKNLKYLNFIVIQKFTDV